MCEPVSACRPPELRQVPRLMRTIADCKAREKETWAKLANYLATGRTIVRERLHF
jgi:hypothetical protein